MGILDKLFGKRKAMEEKEGEALKKILEKMGKPKNEIADFTNWRRFRNNIQK